MARTCGRSPFTAVGCAPPAVLNIFFVQEQPVPCPMKCPTTSREWFQLTLMTRGDEAGGANILSATLLRRNAGRHASIDAINKACSKLVDEHDALHVKILVQQQRVTAIRASIEKFHGATRDYELEIAVLLKKCQIEMKRLDQFRCREVIRPGESSRPTTSTVAVHDRDSERPEDHRAKQDTKSSSAVGSLTCPVCECEVAESSIIRLFLSGRGEDPAEDFWKAVERQAAESESTEVPVKVSEERKARLEESIRWLRAEHKRNAEDIGSLNEQLKEVRSYHDAKKKHLSKMQDRLRTLQHERASLEAPHEHEGDTAWDLKLEGLQCSRTNHGAGTGNFDLADHVCLLAPPTRIFHMWQLVLVLLVEFSFVILSGHACGGKNLVVSLLLPPTGNFLRIRSHAVLECT
ncbi:hypothetical protein C2E23DRAFT_855331 [Lenzites betulinus]|nr:hypothetical protein C2E23DRAFT_855331 [Lenzites betulinus]